MVIPPQWKDANSFSEGLALVINGGKDGFIDKTGKVVIALQFDGASFFREGLAAVFVNRKPMYIDTTGQVVLRPDVEDAIEFSDGLAAVAVNGKWASSSTANQHRIYSSCPTPTRLRTTRAGKSPARERLRASNRESTTDDAPAAGDRSSNLRRLAFIVIDQAVAVAPDPDP
jgi:hypothetical protein